jgi:hypothetical protein
MARNPHISIKTSLKTQRKRLQAKLDGFFQKAPFDVSTLDLQNPFLDESLQDNDWELEDCDSIDNEDDSDKESDEEDVDDVDDVESHPERLRLPLPSLLGKETCSRNGWESMATQETDL